MHAEPYKAKSGLDQFRPVFDDGESPEHFDSEGFCLACGVQQSGVEPDARKYTCESCGAQKVYGIEELLMMGLARAA